MTETANDEPNVAGWTPWRVPGTNGFSVDDPGGNVGLIQLDEKNFCVTKGFRFSDDAIEKDLIDKIVAAENGIDEPEARQMVNDARTFTPSEENPSDLASIPRFMRWFENPYGLHTLAAILHDELIVDEVNGGSLGSDALADRFFRRMLGAAGVPWLKRWIMWAAVALRSRFAAGGGRMVMILFWLALAAAGISSFVAAAGAFVFDWQWPPDTLALLVVAVALPFASAPLWGKQYGASLVAAVAALWILPGAVFGIVGYGVYRALEKGAALIGLE